MDEAVAQGDITQAEADEWLSFVGGDAQAFVNESWDEWDDVDGEWTD